MQIHGQLVHCLGNVGHSPIIGKIMGKEFHVAITLSKNGISHEGLVDTTTNEYLEDGCKIDGTWWAGGKVPQ
jgi:hypothetical protein